MVTLSYYTGRNTQAVRVDLGELSLWFSYATVVAFRAPGRLARVCENVWSKTTGRHLNEIDGGAKASRIPYAEFMAKLEKVLHEHHLQ